LPFSGIGYGIILLSGRPISQKILIKANQNGHEGISFVNSIDLFGLKIQTYINEPGRDLQDKADIQFQSENVDEVNWE
jgi:hypothetical protein